VSEPDEPVCAFCGEKPARAVPFDNEGTSIVVCAKHEGPDTLFARPTRDELSGMIVLDERPGSFVAIKRETSVHPVDAEMEAHFVIDESAEFSPEIMKTLEGEEMKHKAAPYWSSTPPTKPGWYWCRQLGEAEIVELRGLVRADQRLYSNTLHGLEVDEIEDDWTLEFWSEPIAEPPA
jgi:hypothetical protein